MNALLNFFENVKSITDTFLGRLDCCNELLVISVMMTVNGPDNRTNETV